MKSINRIIIMGLILVMTINISGCMKKEETSKETRWSYELEETDETLYKKIVGLRLNLIPEKLKRSTKDVEGKYRNIGDALAWELKKHSDDKDREYHVILEYYDFIYKNPDSNGEIYPEVIEMINEKYNRDFKLEDWSIVMQNSGMYVSYYDTFTADEIFDLSDFGICCYYVGSGKGDIEDVNFETEEGIETFFELYGDGCIQHKKGMKIYY